MSVEGRRYTSGVGLAGEDRVIATVKKLKLAGSVDASDLSEAVKEYRIPFSSDVDGVKVPVSLVQLVDGTKRPIPLVSLSAPWGNGVPKSLNDATLNDSDKDFVVPAGKYWIVESIYIILTTTATVGNRTLNVYSNNVAAYTYYGIYAGLVQPASQAYIYMYYVGAPRQVAVSPYSNPIPRIVMGPGDYLRIRDSAAIDPAADDLNISINYLEYDV